MMKALRIEPADNVAVVAQDTRKGDVLRMRASDRA